MLSSTEKKAETLNSLNGSGLDFLLNIFIKFEIDHQFFICQ